ncbi:MAG: L-rhamnose mutarotase [Lachnotalea sp.]
MAVRRFGDMIKIKPDGLEDYKKWHANPMPGVNEMISKCHLKNYSIYSRGEYLFAYYEYDGDDFEADMAKMADDPTTQAWWNIVKPLMQPLENREKEEFWSGMEEIYHLE